MRLIFNTITPSEHIVWVDEIIRQKDKPPIAQYIAYCKVKNRYTNRIDLKEARYSTEKEANRKLKVWKKIYEREAV